MFSNNQKAGWKNQRRGLKIMQDRNEMRNPKRIQNIKE